jgi:hypothetical protein
MHIINGGNNMHKKIIIGLIFSIVLMIITPSTLGITKTDDLKETISPSASNRNIFVNCYIEASGHVSEIDWPAIIKAPNMWKTTWLRPFNDDRAIVTYWQIVFDSSVDLSIYDKKGGDLLWEHSTTSHEQIRIIGYYGIYNPSRADIEKSLYIDILGNAVIILRTAR